MSDKFSLTRPRFWRTRAATVLAAAGALVMASGLVLMTSSTAQADPPEDGKVVVCKYVGTPGGELHHIVVVSENSLSNTGYVAPPDGDSWTDAHGQTGFGSIAIRYADNGPPPEQASTISLSECPTPPVVELCPEGTDRAGEEVGEEPCDNPEVELCPEGTDRAGEEVGDEDCDEPDIAGTETAKPKPDKKADKAPVVLGTQAAVPTAVAAGYAGESPATSSAMQVLAQLMTAGGLLLLVAGGWIGFGRRESGAHQI